MISDGEVPTQLFCSLELLECVGESEIGAREGGLANLESMRIWLGVLTLFWERDCCDTTRMGHSPESDCKDLPDIFSQSSKNTLQTLAYCGTQNV